ncbi:fusaric acid resistance domain protein [Klebsiella grimontii]|uniref:Fusaric acid resistance domain protein n=1 Tax=Klebsiella grimontii TaxID=2058152 RepID=A0A7H4P4P7_9ENTR|nr:fusaric acid resistance domain protein [Klebsiella grimontii]
MATPALLSDAHALLYSVRSFAAAMLAYYLALAIGLERPSWAIITVYIVSQTSVGRLPEQEPLSPGGYRGRRGGHGVDCAHVCEYADFMQRDADRLDHLLPLFVPA